ncbi:hypothetical protein HOT49_gp189 [Erwinia phage vB_EamM_Alexandra]|uniref:Uncharacterized protein n=1 Tax=Erwinia phage vB_EamM_Alexandra TaxID=2201424 RepID=A0A2Z4QEA9_9CAUD|nr:hypothetical protein HOT49_gp189 [Erwinia phage vB_EamM_Alexandra]AWY08605.1 hypothetical protein Alexandra_191 [Erwinia phage vB_EamM_Alexandra]
MELMVSLSALPPSMYRKYRKGWKPNPTLLKLFEKISGKKGHKAMRIYIDAKTDAVIKNVTQGVVAPVEIVDALMEKNIVLVDYVAGTGKDSHGRIVKIGKYLAKDPDLKKMFDSDPKRKSLVNATRNHQLICISMHPYDIAGMSTDRGWVSCMNLKTGSNKKYVKQDIAGGTLIAYLIEPQDKNINKPIARCLAKPFFQRQKAKASERFVGSEKVNALYLVEFAYPDSKMPFVHTLQDWLNEQINPFIATTERKGVFELGSKLYVDQRHDTFDYDVEGPMLRNDVNGFVERLVTTKSKDAEDSALQYMERHPQIATMLAQKKWGQPRFYQRCTAELVAGGHFTELRRFFDVLFKNFVLDDAVMSKVWEYLSGKPQALSMFIDAIPNAQRDSFLDANLGEMDLYRDTQSAIVNGAFPAALSEIWSFAKYSKNPEQMFWYNACRINSARTQTQYVDEEFGEENSSSYRDYVLTPAIASLAAQNPKCPAATLESLRRHKDMLTGSYYRVATRVFEGEKVISLDDREDFNPKMKEALANLTKPKLTASERAKLRYKVMGDDMLQQAAEELYPDSSNMSRSAIYLLVDSQQSPEVIRQAIINRALELGMQEALEQVDEMRADAKAYRAKMKAKK